MKVGIWVKYCDDTASPPKCFEGILASEESIIAWLSVSMRLIGGGREWLGRGGEVESVYKVRSTVCSVVGVISSLRPISLPANQQWEQRRGWATLLRHIDVVTHSSWKSQPANKSYFLKCVAHCSSISLPICFPLGGCIFSVHPTLMIVPAEAGTYSLFSHLHLICITVLLEWIFQLIWHQIFSGCVLLTFRGKNTMFFDQLNLIQNVNCCPDHHFSATRTSQMLH